MAIYGLALPMLARVTERIQVRLFGTTIPARLAISTIYLSTHLTVDYLRVTPMIKLNKAERTGAANLHAFGTSGISPAEQARMPEASGDT